MKLRRFTGANTHEALQQVKRVLGDEAVILETECVPGGVVVTAAIDDDAVVASQTQGLRAEARALSTTVRSVTDRLVGIDADHVGALERSLARQGVDGLLAAAFLSEVRGCVADGSVSRALAAVLRRQTRTTGLTAIECFIGPRACAHGNDATSDRD